MLAPIALYPDSLLSQILMAASYPREVAQAASWSRSNRAGRGEDAVRAAQNEPWDPSVISLTAFPQVLQMMAQRPDWTDRLGEAYINQTEQVMATIQNLRARADEAGTLRDSEQLTVQREGSDYVIESPQPEVVYVPYYDPRVAYGSWWWPDYQPVYWRPWVGYDYNPYYGFGWGYGITISSGFWFGGIDWRHRYVRYSNHRPWYWHGRDWRRGDRWSHDHNRRATTRDVRWRGGDGRGGDGRWRGGDGRTRGDRADRGDRGAIRDDRSNAWRDAQRGQRQQQVEQRGTASSPNPAERSATTPRYYRGQEASRGVQPGEAVRAEGQRYNGTMRPGAEASVGGPSRRVYRAPEVQQQPVQQQPQQYVAPPVQQAAPAPRERSSSNPAARAERSESRSERSEPRERSSGRESSGPGPRVMDR